ncbi:unnamed protein product [Urochloa humidicola]
MSNESKGVGSQDLHESPPTPLPSQELDEFWKKTLEDIENTVNFNDHILPVSYVAKIIRDNQGSLMMSAETSPCVTKVLEIFIQELTVRAWMCAKSHDRPSTILESDIYEAINSSESHAFLKDLLQRPRSINVLQPQQESHLIAATSTLTENGPTDLYKSGEQALQIPKDNLDPATSAQPGLVELKNIEDLNMPATSSGSIKETK